MFYFSTFKIIYCNDDKKCKNYYIYTVLFLNSNISRILTLKKQKQVASYKAVHYLTLHISGGKGGRFYQPFQH